MNDNTYHRDRRKTRGDFASREQTTDTFSNMIIHAMKTANGMLVMCVISHYTWRKIESYKYPSK